MASKKVKAAIKGSIAGVEAAQAVIQAVDSSKGAAAIVAIPTPATATAAEIAAKVNELIAALKG